MASYNDERNWDQEELDRARELAKDNVVSDGATVPQAARLNADKQLDQAEPSPVLEGERPTTEDERETVEAQGVGSVIPSNGANEGAESGAVDGDTLFKDSEKNKERTGK